MGIGTDTGCDRLFFFVDAKATKKTGRRKKTRERNRETWMLWQCVCVCVRVVFCGRFRIEWDAPSRLSTNRGHLPPPPAAIIGPAWKLMDSLTSIGATCHSLSRLYNMQHTHTKKGSPFFVCVCVCVFRCVYQTVLIPPPFSSKGWSLLAAQRGGPLQRFKLGKNIGTVWTTLSSGSSVAENHRVDERAQFVSLFFFFFFFSRLLVLRIVSSSLDPEIARCSNWEKKTVKPSATPFCSFTFVLYRFHPLRSLIKSS